MKTMRNLLAVGLLSLAFAGIGCGSDADTGKYEAAIKAMCECKDEACMDKARDDRQAFRKELGKKFKKKEDAPESLVKKMDELDDKWSDCRDKAEEALKGAAPAE